MTFEFNRVNAVYTGGNIWLFYGSFTNGYYFLTGDMGDTVILTHSPSNFDVSLYDDWIEANKVKDLEGDELKGFLSALLWFTENGDAFHDGGFTSYDLEVFKKWWEVDELHEHFQISIKG